jgi:quercetin dioxygenase-like cupin family protein
MESAMGRLFVNSNVLTAAIAAFVSSLLTMIVTNAIAPAAAQGAPAPTVGLLTQKLDDLPGREMRMTLLDREPGNASPMHRHPGHHTFGYVIQGTYELGTGGRPTRILHAGDTFYEPPGELHSVSRNASMTERLKILICMVSDSSKPSTVNE